MRILTGLLLAATIFAANVTYSYDAAGRLLTATWDNGVVVTYTYDKAGNLLGRTVPGPAPQITANGIVNAASYTAPLVRGELAALFGQKLAASTASASFLPLPTSLAGVQVTVNGVLAPLYYVSPGQINFQVPLEAPVSGSAPVTVRLNGSVTSAQQVSMAEYSPAIYTYARTATLLDPIVVHATTYALVTPDNPASAGETLVIYATGAGTFDFPPATGAGASSTQLARTSVTPAVTVGGVSAAVGFSGLAPGYVGLLQLNIVLPAPLPGSGTLPLKVQFNPSASASANLYVR